MAASSSDASPTTNKSDSAQSSKHFFSKNSKRKPSKKGKEVSAATNNGEHTKASPPAPVSANGDGVVAPSQSTTADVAASDGAVQHASTGAGAGQVPTQATQALLMSGGKEASLTSPPVSAEPSNASENKEKDKGSLSTSITGTASNSKHNQTRTASDAAHSSPTGPPVKSKPPKPKQSFISKLVQLLNCVGPAKAAQLDNGDAMSALSDPSASAERLKEKQVLLEGKEPQIPVAADAPKSAHAVEPSTSSPAAAAPLTVAPDLVLNLPTDPAVIVPPSPTKQTLSESETGGLTSGAVQPPGSTGENHARDGEDSDGTSFTEDEDIDKELESAEDEEERLIMNGGIGIPIGPDGMPRPLLPPIAPQHAGRKCLVLDMDETLLHSSFKSIQHADYVIPVEIEYHWHNVYVIKRPGVDNFLKKMGELYEVVVFTASLSKYADPVLDKLDVHQVVSHRLFRESCYNHKGNYVKDLSQLGRPMADTIILDNSPASYIFHPNNAVPVSSWFNDPHDTELTDLCPFLTDLRTVDDVRGVLDGGL